MSLTSMFFVLGTRVLLEVPVPEQSDMKTSVHYVARTPNLDTEKAFIVDFQLTTSKVLAERIPSLTIVA